ncbi:hypothetical protein COOONC_06223 [Cooperia oncophora]
MSEHSKHLHTQLLKALTIQAFLPIFFLISVISYAIGQFDICHHPLLEYTTFLVGIFIPLLSPITTFYFVHPYRVWIRDKLLCLRKLSESHSSESQLKVPVRSSLETSAGNF